VAAFRRIRPSPLFRGRVHDQVPSYLLRRQDHLFADLNRWFEHGFCGHEGFIREAPQRVSSMLRTSFSLRVRESAIWKLSSR
jgi:hypothetical protein